MHYAFVIMHLDPGKTYLPILVVKLDKYEISWIEMMVGMPAYIMLPQSVNILAKEAGFHLC